MDSLVAHLVAVLSAFGHGGDEEQVDDLADEQQSAGEEPDEPGDPLAVVEAVDAAEADEAAAPEQV